MQIRIGAKTVCHASHLASGTCPRTSLSVGFVFVCCFSLVIADRSHVQAEEVQWEQVPHDAAADASRLQRPIVVYVSAKNCIYCRQMERDTWHDQQVVSNIAEDWIPLKVDAGNNPKLAEAFQVHTYPTTLLYSHDRRLITRLEGFFSADLLRESLRKAHVKRQSAARANR